MSIEGREPSAMSRLFRRILVWFYRKRGWKAEGRLPTERRFILVAAPHTSNWDFVNFLGLTEDLGLYPRFMAKESLFRWPWRNFLFDMGGVPVERSSRQNYVQQMIEEFGRRDDFVLTVAPEGTRSHASEWKTGFYHIAVGANVPIILGFMDYARKTGGIGAVIQPSGNFARDMKKMAEFYAGVTPRFPEKATDYRSIVNDAG